MVEGWSQQSLENNRGGQEDAKADRMEDRQPEDGGKIGIGVNKEGGEIGDGIEAKRCPKD